MYAALIELERLLTLLLDYLTGAALVISAILLAIYIGCFAKARRKSGTTQGEEKNK